MAYANKNLAEFWGRLSGRDSRASRSDLSPVGTYTYHVRYIPTAGGSDAISVVWSYLDLPEGVMCKIVSAMFL